jgi:hypothetical protein
MFKLRKSVKGILEVFVKVEAAIYLPLKQPIMLAILHFGKVAINVHASDMALRRGIMI